MELDEFVKIYRQSNLLSSKCTNPTHDEFGHICEEIIELKAALNKENRVNIAEELADVVILVAVYANKIGIDLAFAIEKKTVENFRNGRLATINPQIFTTKKLTEF